MLVIILCLNCHRSWESINRDDAVVSLVGSVDVGGDTHQQKDPLSRLLASRGVNLLLVFLDSDVSLLGEKTIISN